jgi:hypothetical protein
MTKLNRRVLICVLGVALLVPLLVVLHNYRTRRALAARKAQLVSQGERLTVEGLTPLSSPEAQRAASDLLQAAWRLGSGAVIPQNLPRGMFFIAPGKAGVGWKQPDIRTPESTNTWEELAAQLKVNELALEQIREALKCPRLDMNLNYKMGFNLTLPHLAKLKTVAHWLLAATMSDLHAGKLEAAAANLTALISLANAFHDERPIISQLVRFAITAIDIGPTWEALQTDGWTDAQLADLQQHWVSLEFMEAMEKAVEMERASGLELFQRLRNASAAERRQMFEGVSSPSPGPVAPTNTAELADYAFQIGKQKLSRLNSFGQANAWRWLWSYGDELCYVETSQVVLEGSRRAQATGSFLAARSDADAQLDRFERDEAGDSGRYVVSHLQMAGLRKAFSKVARIDTQRELTVTAIALKRYQMRHTKLPPNLAALVPDFLPRPPKDFMDGHELRYRCPVDGSFLLYSVNEDGKDDGGDATRENPQSRNFSEGRDMVWPMPATADEVAAANAKAPNGAHTNLMFERYGLAPKENSK